jgi:hypothetical protein
VEREPKVSPTNRLPSDNDPTTPGTFAADAGLWLVSFGDDDDRELLPSQIAEALRRGDITPSTIVWRDGLPDWLPIAQVAALADLVSAGGETATAPLVMPANLALSANPTEDVTTAPGIGDDSSPPTTRTPQTKALADAAPAIKPVDAAAPVAPTAEAKSEDPATENKPVPAWRGKTKIGLPKVDGTKPELSPRRLEPVKGTAVAKIDLKSARVPAVAKAPAAVTTAKPADVTANPAAVTTAKPADVTANPAAVTTAKPADVTASPAIVTTTTAAVVDAPAVVAAPKETTAKPAEVAAAKPLAADAPTPKPPIADVKAKPLPGSTEAVHHDGPRPPPMPERRATGLNTTGFKKPEPVADAKGLPKGAPKPPPRAPHAPVRTVEKVDPAPVSVRTGRGARDIWSDHDDDAEPISIESSAMQAPTPSPSPNITKATALSSGTLGLTRKPAPKPPTPKHAPAPPPPVVDEDLEANAGTPLLQALSAPLSTRTETERVDDLLNLSVAPAKVTTLTPPIARAQTGTPTVPMAPVAPPVRPLGSQVAPVIPPAAPPVDLPPFEDLSSDMLVETDDGEPTRPLNLAPSPDLLTEEPAPAPRPVRPTGPPASARPSSSPPSKKKRSLVPFVAIGALVALAVSIGLKKVGDAGDGAASAPTATEVAPAEPAPTPPPAAVTQQAPAAASTSVAPPTLAEAPAAAEAPTAKATVPTAPPVPGPTEVTTKVAEGEKHANVPVTREPKATAPAEPKRPAVSEAPPKAVDMGGDFDRASAAAALGAAASSASGCRKEGDPTGLAVVHVTFTNSGKATRATIEGPPFAGTATGGCIAAAMRGAKVPPFGGDKVTVTKRVVIQ